VDGSTSASRLFASDQYQLIDFGAGRKLERFGAYVLDRPAPSAAAATRREPQQWETADARFERDDAGGRWVFARKLAPVWTIRCGYVTFDLKFGRFGQVGLFPEQSSNWHWIAEQVCAAGQPCKVLNLFAYTGASTLAAAAAGASVTHVDAASGVVSWARHNTAASNLSDAPVRWIADDAIKFARRELKRGSRYDAVILDPPSYGHGPGGEVWKLADGLGELMELCLKLSAVDRRFLLLTCHSGEFATASGLLKGVLQRTPRVRESGSLEASDLFLHSAGGGRLHCGAAVRWTAPALASASKSSQARRQTRALGDR
jgi:23S rRNA (cytosine1962-C5)-methyltransferase